MAKSKEVKGFNKNQLLKISETLKDYKALLPRYLEVRDNFELLFEFCKRQRSTIWDLNMFKTGLLSEAVMEAKVLNKTLPKNKKIKITEEHVVNRTLTAKIVFDFLVKNPSMSMDEFVEIMSKYGSTIKLTKKEHDLLPKKTKGFHKKTISDYEDNGIIVPGLTEHIEYLNLINL